jgi:hypothetical protein
MQSNLTIDQKINFRAYAWLNLEWNQYMQLVKLNKLVLAPYYKQRLIEQGRHVADTENFKASHYGKNRWEYENNI